MDQYICSKAKTCEVGRCLHKAPHIWWESCNDTMCVANVHITDRSCVPVSLLNLRTSEPIMEIIKAACVLTSTQIASSKYDSSVEIALRKNIQLVKKILKEEEQS